MISLHSLDFGPLNCSLDRVLGDYYQDFLPAIDLVESGYHGGLDDEGVPLVRYRNQGTYYNAVIPAQYALANMIALRRGDHARADRVRVQLNWLVAEQEATGELAGCWLMNYDNPKYPWLQAPWTSAMASGNAISALLRGWELFGDERYRVAADAAYAALHVARTSMVLCQENGEELWYEEYPAEPPLRVLNGHVYALLGVVDHARVTGEPEAEARWRRAAATLLSHLDEFDLGYWSAYD
ncbi:MAG: D-glucuronyl C5-epimerase family protein, partial [Actinomycetota bacterium]|nr:D-glucuronyl C5-epimerase family protein [Actinomycetota bacterium]